MSFSIRSLAFLLICILYKLIEFFTVPAYLESLANIWTSGGHFLIAHLTAILHLWQEHENLNKKIQKLNDQNFYY